MPMAVLSSEVQVRESWKTGIAAERPGYRSGPKLQRQPRYPRHELHALRSVALRRHLSMGLPNFVDYAQSIGAWQGRTMQLET